MFNTVAEFLTYLQSQAKFSIKLHLSRIAFACELLGNPQKKLKTIHIAGTNGKGSTCNYLNNLLQASGFKVGMYVSPYIICFNERIQINNVYISDEDLIECANLIYPIIKRVEETLNDEMTEFEIITLLSFVYFEKKAVDYVIYEVGLGGRYDATNVITPIVAGITNISYDHMNVLGNTLEKIAYEKIGIAKENLTIFTTEDKDNPLQVFKDYCNSVNANLNVLSIDEISNEMFLDDGISFHFNKLNLDLFIPMLGKHQLKNGLLALEIYLFLINERKLSINREYIYRGLTNAKWAGRLEIISKSPFIIIDGSHNIDGVKTLVEAMQYYIKQGYEVNTVFAALKDKETDKMLSLLAKLSTRLTLTSFNFYRANTAYNLFKQIEQNNVYYDEDFKKVISNEITNLSSKKILLITGSLYFISQVKSFFNNKQFNDKEC